MRLRTSLALVLALFAPSACDSEGSDNTDDTSIADTEVADTVLTDTAVTDTGSEETVPNTWGFPMRYPQEHTVSCSGRFGTEELEQLELDWICTFEYGGNSGHVYIQATPTACKVAMSATPVFGDAAGWIALDGAVSALPEATYDWGGNHHNDSLGFMFGDKSFRYYHSSFGYGWRKCQPMDCLQVNDGGGELVEDGCTADRTLPAVCRAIAADGTWDDMTDTFERCLGDPNNEGR
ncbi:MAG: hypothetical protein CSA66_03395 [Proteobacteria bacterium]|nr:MAG: hypothetical protein CSA66_03395 [Pseudomonadota bacterium]